MKHIPILYSKPMVLACLEGRKTETRRILRNQPAKGFSVDSLEGGYINWIANSHYKEHTFSEKLPHKIGDVLWVRETWTADCNAIHLKPSEMDAGSPIWYDADGSSRNTTGFSLRSYKNIPSIFMPKWASRMSQIVTDVRVQRLQDISKQDCQKEGHPRDHYHKYSDQVNLDAARDWYMDLWDSLNGKPRRLSNGSLGYDISWDANPWVVATTFEVVNKNINVLDLPS